MSDYKYMIEERAAALFMLYAMRMTPDAVSNILVTEKSNVENYMTEEPLTGEDYSDNFVIATVLYDDGTIHNYMGFTQEFVAKRIIRDTLENADDIEDVAAEFIKIVNNIKMNNGSCVEFLESILEAAHIERLHWNI